MPNVPVFFSVVIPLYNKEATIDRAIKSVLNQTVQDFEIVVVNDGSTDNGPDVVAAIKDSRIRLIDQDNQGVSAARNRGIAEAKHDLIAFLDADDEWEFFLLEEIICLRRQFPHAKVFATSYRFCDGSYRYNYPLIKKIPPAPWRGIINNYFSVACQSDPPICSSAVSVTRTAINAVEGFPIGIESGEDLVTWARLSVKFPIAYTRRSCATFWRPPLHKPREPQLPDMVAKILNELLKDAPQCHVSSIKKYIALWHKMRATSYLKLGNQRGAFRDVSCSVKAGGLSTKNLMIIFLLPFPTYVVNRLFNGWHYILRYFKESKKQNKKA